MRNAAIRRLLALFFAALLMLPGVASARQERAGSVQYKVTLAANNFGQNLFAYALDLSNPGRALFGLQNGTPFWYGVSAQSTPANIAPFPADANDLVTNVFDGTLSLLPADDVLPSNYAYGQQHIPILKLAISFTGPGEQAQVTLNPYEPHAALMDVISLLLHLLGEQTDGLQIGLLAPHVLSTIFNSALTMRYLQSLSDDFASLLQSVPDQGDASSLLQDAYTCARDLSGLVSDATERVPLANILWLARSEEHT